MPINRNAFLRLTISTLIKSSVQSFFCFVGENVLQFISCFYSIVSVFYIVPKGIRRVSGEYDSRRGG